MKWVASAICDGLAEHKRLSSEEERKREKPFRLQSPPFSPLLSSTLRQNETRERDRRSYVALLAAHDSYAQDGEIFVIPAG